MKGWSPPGSAAEKGPRLQTLSAEAYNGPGQTGHSAGPPKHSGQASLNPTQPPGFSLGKYVPLSGPSLGGASDKEPVCPCSRHKRRVRSPGSGRSLKRAWPPHPVFLPAFQGQRSLGLSMGYGCTVRHA